MKIFKRRKKTNFDDEIIIGKTDNKAIVSVCKNCECFLHIPHLNYYDKKKKRSYTLNILKAQMVDHCYLLDLDQRIDLEYFLSKYNEEAKMINWDLAIKTWNDNYEVKIPDSCNVAIYFDKAEYLYPLSSKLTDEEIEILIKFLSRKCEGKYVRKLAGDITNWEYLIFAWNNENTGGNWCYYQEKEKLSDDLGMPDYRKLK